LLEAALMLAVGMPNRDANKDALEQVEQITESSRDNGEDLLESEDLKRQLREARQREGLPEPSRQEPVE
jgi:hypothetical protein